jgi:hypothetical protein
MLRINLINQTVLNQTVESVIRKTMKTSATQSPLFLLIFILALCLGLTDPAKSAVSVTISPNIISNTYAGPIALSITGLTNSADAVVVQKFLDLNGSGLIASNDLLVQQFYLKVGNNSVIGGVTNYNVPGDLGSATNAISAVLNFPGADFMQNLVGQYLFKVSSVSNDFTAITNSFVVNSFPYAQGITGNVYSNGVSQTLPGCVVVLFPAPRAGQHGPGNPVGGTVANGVGDYTLKTPPGVYVPAAFRSGYLLDYGAAPVVTVSNSVTVTTNLSVQIATNTISGTVVDAANNAIGIPGVLFPAQSQSGQLAVCFTDTNGNFSLNVGSGNWSLGSFDPSLTVHGYVGYQNGTNVAAGSTGVIIGFPQATALFYGHVRDGAGNPLASVDIGDQDQNNGLYQSDALTDTNGYYVLAVLGGLGSSDPWSVGYSGNPSPYIFSSPPFDQNGGTNINAGQVVLADFTGLVATNFVTGNVQFNGTNVIGAGVSAYATINGLGFNLNTVDTDANGNYSLAVANGNWSVFVNCQGGRDSLDNLLGSTNYSCPNNDNVAINNNNGIANFSVAKCGGVQIISTSLPAGQVGAYYNNFLAGSTCSGNQIWSVIDSQDFPSSLFLAQNGEIVGTPDTATTYNFTVQLSDGNGNSTTQALSLTINAGSGPLTITTTSLPNATNGTFYSLMFQASGGTPPYNWFIPGFSAGLPPNLNLATNGLVSGTPSSSTGGYYFDVIVTDAASNTNEMDGLVLNVVNPPLAPLIITNISLPNATVGAPYNVQLGAIGGQSPYNWSLASGSASPPSGLTLFSSGMILGTPTNSKVGFFKVQVNDQSSDVTNKIFSITINPKPVLSALNWLTNQFRMLLTGASNQNYTVQSSTNLSLSNWTSLYVTNSAATNSFIILDSHATNSAHFYRILIGP